MGRKLLEQKSRIDPEQRYAPREALELLKDLEGAKFDESIEAHVHLNVDPRRADQMVGARLCCRMARARRAGSRSSPRARRPGRPRSQGPTWSARTILRRASRTRALWTSTWPSQPRIR